MTTFLSLVNKFKKQGKSNREATALALLEAKALKEEAEKKAHKEEKKRKAKEDAKRNRDKKQRGKTPLCNLADDTASAD